MLGAGRECATAFKALLELIHQIVLKPTPENKKKLPTFSKEVATSVGEVVQAAEAIRGEGRERIKERGREGGRERMCINWSNLILQLTGLM